MCLLLLIGRDDLLRRRYTEVTKGMPGSRTTSAEHDLLGDEPAVSSPALRSRLAPSPHVFIVSQLPWGRVESDHVTRLTGVAEARRAFKAQGPRLVIADLDLFDGSGLEILSMVDGGKRLGACTPACDVVLVGASLDRRVLRGAERARRWLRSQSSKVEELVDSALGQPPSPTAELVDYCALATIGQRPISMHVATAAGEPIGAVHVRSSLVWTAVDGHGVGMPAFERILRRTGNGRSPTIDHVVRCSSLSEDTVIDPIQCSFATTIEECLTSDRGPSTVPPSFVGVSGPRSFRPSTLRPRHETIQGLHVDLEGSFKELWDVAVDAILAKRYAEALAAFQRADRIRPGDPHVQANLERLRQLGFK